jgi:hypothetical protein
MRLSHLNVRRNRVAAALFAAAIVAYALYTTGHYVTAYRETKSAHVFPTTATATGWDTPEAALSQELGANAPFESFDTTNSAHLSIAGNTPVVETPNIPPSAPDSTEQQPVENATTTPEAAPSGSEAPTAEPEQVPPAVVPEQTPSAPVETPSAVPAETPAATPAETPTTPATEAPPVETSVSKIFHTITSSLVKTAYATTTESALPDDTGELSNSCANPGELQPLRVFLRLGRWGGVRTPKHADGGGPVLRVDADERHQFLIRCDETVRSTRIKARIV